MDTDAPPSAPPAGRRPWRADLREVAALFLGWRGGLLFIGYLTVLLTLPWSPARDANPRWAEESFVARLFMHFDAGWFVNIAEHGYLPSKEGLQGNAAFWPGFPLAMRALAAVTRSTVWAGVLLSNLALFGALVFLRRIGDRLVGAEAARRTLVFYLVFPASFYLSVPYSDALFLCLAAASFLAFLEDRWLAAALLAAAAAFTRSSGVFLGVAYVVAWLHGRRWRPWPVQARVLVFALVPLGVVGFMLILRGAIGEPLAFARVEGAHGWERRFTFPPSFLLRRLWELFQHAFVMREKKIVVAFDFVDMASIGMGLALLPAVWRRLGLAAFTFAVTVAVLPLTTGLTSGTTRYAMSLFPVFLALGAWADRPSRERPLIALMAALQPLYMYLYMSGLAPP